MAVIWQERTSQKRYQVRSAGQSVRLYTNGVFHSQYNPAHLFQGSLWDMLALPCLAAASDAERLTGLVLGVGGGATMRYIQGYASWQRIVGVDLDARHLFVARQFFGVQGRGVKLVKDDALRFVANGSAGRVDYLVDDLFGEARDETGLPTRAVEITADWLDTLQTRLTDGGVLVLNVESVRQSKRVMRTLRQTGGFRSVFLVSNDQYYNVVMACAKREVTRHQFLHAWKALRGPRNLPCKITFHQLTDV